MIPIPLPSSLTPYGRKNRTPKGYDGSGSGIGIIWMGEQGIKTLFIDHLIALGDKISGSKRLLNTGPI
jgi:hypothetical protein